MSKLQFFRLLLFITLLGFRAEQWYFMAHVVQPAHTISAASTNDRFATFKRTASSYRVSAFTHVDRPDVTLATFLLPIEQPSHKLIVWNLAENLTPGLVDGRKPLDALLN